mgnify:CR=1 FL=1
MAHTEHFDTIYHDNTPHIEENGIANILPPELQGVDITLKYKVTMKWRLNEYNYIPQRQGM